MAALVELFKEFFSLGLFSYGGGLAILALLQERIADLGWMSAGEFANMIAISQSTPGPIAANLATFVGYTQGGVIGSLLATFAVILPGSTLSLIIARFMVHFNEKPLVKAILKGLRAVVIGLIINAVIGIAKVSLLDIPAFEASKNFWDLLNPITIIMFVAIFTLDFKFKKDPFFYIIPAGIIGMFLL